MPVRVVNITLQSPVFDRAKRERIVSQGLTRIGKRFKKKVVDTMVQTPARGRTYKKGAGTGFTRSHRASRRGDPPAPDTMNLVRSVKDKKLSPTSHEIYVDGAQAPYGDYLERPRLDRPIMGQKVLREFENSELREETMRIARELGGTS